ncbi:hypothetical protein D3C75_1102140 [compost metagenome]
MAVPATAVPIPLRRLSRPAATWPIPLALNSALRTTLPSDRYSWRRRPTSMPCFFRLALLASSFFNSAPALAAPLSWAFFHSSRRRMVSPMTFCKPLARAVCASSLVISPLTFLNAAPSEELTTPPITSPRESLFAMKVTCVR